MLRYALWSCCLLFLRTCAPDNPKQIQPSASYSDTLSEQQEDPRFKSVRSVAEVKDLIVEAFLEHRGDSVYAQFFEAHDEDGYTYQAEVQVGFLFHPSLKSAVIGYSTTDTTIEVQVFHFIKEEWKQVLEAKKLPFERGGTDVRSEFLFCKNDYDNDDWKDLEVNVNVWDGIGVGYRSRLWLVRKDRFVFVKNFENIDSPELYKSTQTICSYLSGGCSDMAMHYSTWKLQGDAVTKTKDVDVDCCVGIGPDCAISINGGKRFAVPANKVHLYVPKYFKESLKEKMEMGEEGN